MTFRTRILLACLIVATVPLAIFAAGARNAARSRLNSEFQARMDASGAMIRDGLARRSAEIDARLRALGERMGEDPERRAALVGAGSRAALLDYAPEMMPAAGLDYLVILDEAGVILSSGHFRNEYDRTVGPAAAMLEADGPVLLHTRRPDGELLVLARAVAVQLAGRRYTLAGGVEVDADLLRDLGRDAAGDLALAIEYPGGSVEAPARQAVPAGGRALRERIGLAYFDDVAGEADRYEAYLTLTHSLAALDALRRATDLWFAGALGAAIILAALAARILAGLVNRPLEELADKAGQVQLDRIDVTFATGRRDEIGTLSRVLDAMVRRLRASAAELRAAERRATIGDVARQVNHDVRNGLIPIRNVIRHLAELAETDPASVGPVFAERAETLNGGIAYLEALAGQYARLAPAPASEICDVNALIRSAVQGGLGNGVIRLALSPEPARVIADPVALRRIIENLVVNAVESLADDDGRVTVHTSVSGAGDDNTVTIAVADTGRGIQPDQIDRVFDDFYTTKEHGTGLGLSIVRRLVGDLGGRIRVDSRPGAGTTFTVELPAAP